MNPTLECGCCPSTDCNDCIASRESQCSTAYYRKSKTEMQNGEELICTLRNCNIFGEHDTNPSPKFPYQTKRNNSKDKNKNSLGSPIGLAASNVNFKTEGKTSDMIKARFATYLKVLARLHLNSETSWNSAVIDDIMKEGLLLYTKSEKEDNEMESSPDIYTSNEMSILRKFELSGFTFHIELMPKLKLNTSASSEREAKGDGNTMELTLKDLKAALKEFFRQQKYCLLTVDAFYLMIWRLKGAYFVFDACGRRLTDFNSDEDKGVAMLICLSSLENVRHLIANLSGLQNEDPLLIREIKVVKVVTPSGTIMKRDYLTRTHQYQVVNDDYAYLKSSLHLTLNRRDLLRNRSSLHVAVSAIVASKIDHPATWDIQMTDKIICFGVNFCQNCWKKYTVNEIIDVSEFATFFNMGQFQITIDIITHKYEGTWRCVPDFKHSELAESIRRSFEMGDEKLLVQINYQIYAVWKKNDFIYIFDPYRHRIFGKQNESEIYKEMEKSATVRMFRSFEVFMNAFNHILLDSNRTSTFYIHALKVKNIQRRHTSHMNEDIVKLNDRVKLDDADEIISINEHICFEEAENLCQNVLGEISDYEDEDLRSDVDEIELKTSSSEAEIIEEEEPSLEALEEIEGLETSSSGEEGGNYNKSTGGAISKGKSGKGKGHKGGDGKNKGQKGKGSTDKEGGGRERKKGNQIKSGESSNDKTRKSNKFKKSKIRGQEDENKSIGDENDNKENQDDDQQKERAKDKEDKNESDKNEKDKNLKGKSKSKDSKSKNDEDKNIKDLEKDGGGNKSQANKDETSKNEKGKDEDAKENKNKEVDDNNDKENENLDKENIDLLNLNTNVSKGNKDRQNPGNGHEKGLTNKDFKKENIVDSLEKNKDTNTKDSTKDEGKQNKDQNKIENSTNNNNKDPKNQSNAQNPIKNKKNDQNKIEDPAKNEGKDEKDKLQIEDSIKDNAADKKDHNKVESPAKNDSKDEDQGKIKGDKNLSILNKDDKNNIDNTNGEFTQNKSSKYDLNKGKLSSKGNDKENEFEDIGKDYDKVTSQHKMVKQNRLKGTEYRIFDDGTEADDENEDDFFKKSHRYCLPNPDHYPGYLKQPVDMAVVCSENGSYESICKLFQAGFKISDRILTMTPWGNFVVFRCINHSDPKGKHYFLFDGCTCNFNYFRRLDLSIGTAGLICFEHMHNIIKYIRCLCKSRRKERAEQKYTADDICQQYYSRNYNIRL